MKVKVIFLPYIFQVLYVLCCTRPLYQLSVYRTIRPLDVCGENLISACANSKGVEKPAHPHSQISGLIIKFNKDIYLISSLNIEFQESLVSTLAKHKSACINCMHCLIRTSARSDQHISR